MFAPPGVGYDRGLLFSPQGRLYQVEYAIEAVKRGTTAVGCRNDDAVILAVEKRVSPLQEKKGMEKIFQIDSHVACAISGLTADARVLIDQARVEAQVNILSYDQPITVEEVTRAVCDLMQVYTHNVGVRPFGVALLVAGVDPSGKPQLFMTDPSGAYWAYFAWAIGSGESAAREYLEQNYKRDASVEELQLLALRALKEVMETPLTSSNCELVQITSKDKQIRRFTEDELKALIDRT
ncbi:MAG: archaeal proteasome endopeptidase complex subunit alpha [Promethearchaeota archaeon]